MNVVDGKNISAASIIYAAGRAIDSIREAIQQIEGFNESIVTSRWKVKKFDNEFCKMVIINKYNLVRR